jgi:hypothetical protein
MKAKTIIVLLITTILLGSITQATINNEKKYHEESDVTSDNSPPEFVSFVVKPTQTFVHIPVEVFAIVRDPDGFDKIKIEYDFGDGPPKTTTYSIGAKQIHFFHPYDDKGNYIIEVTGIDEYGASVSRSQSIIVQKSKIKLNPVLDFIENHPYLFPLLRQILGLKNMR